MTCQPQLAVVLPIARSFMLQLEYVSTRSLYACQAARVTYGEDKRDPSQHSLREQLLLLDEGVGHVQPQGARGYCIAAGSASARR